MSQTTEPIRLSDPIAFWDFQNGKITEAMWEERLRSGKRSAHAALADRDTAKVLGVMFNRIYTLRNQLIHDGATGADAWATYQKG